MTWLNYVKHILLQCITLCVRLKEVMKRPATERKFCHSCNLLLNVDEWKDHKAHIVRGELSDGQLNNPSTFITRLESNKSNAVSTLL